MAMKRAARPFLILILVLIVFMPPVSAQVPGGSEVERRINELVARMTLAEKLGQLQILDGEAVG